MQPDALVKRADEAGYAGNGVCSTGSGQAEVKHVKRGKCASFDIRFQADGPSPVVDVLRVTDDGRKSGFKNKYTHGPVNVTATSTSRTTRSIRVTRSASR